MNLPDALHRLAHRLHDDKHCRCRLAAYQAGWKARRDSELREMELRAAGQPVSPDDLDAQFRALIADSERGVEDAA